MFRSTLGEDLYKEEDNIFLTTGYAVKGPEILNGNDLFPNSAQKLNNFLEVKLVF